MGLNCLCNQGLKAMITYPVESLNPMLISPPVVCVRWTRIHVCINLFKHNNSISSTWFEKKIYVMICLKSYAHLYMIKI